MKFARLALQTPRSPLVCGGCCVAALSLTGSAVALEIKRVGSRCRMRMSCELNEAFRVTFAVIC